MGVFGTCACTKGEKDKADDKSITCILVGLSEESKAYRLLDPKTKKIITSKDVIFEENKQWDWKAESSKGKEIEAELTWENSDLVDDNSDGEPEEASEPAVIATEVGTSAVGAREGRSRRPPSYLQDYVMDGSNEDESHAVEDSPQDPVTYEDAARSDKWRKAMDVEMESIRRNQTWELVDLPPNIKCIGVKWLYKTKLNEKGDVEKYKARLVAKGYGQEQGIDYTEVYAPVARMDTIRMMIAVAAQRGWNILQMDVKSTFLHGTLQENVYVQQPLGYVVEGSEHKVCKLRKALYGLKQAPRAWFSRLESYFVGEGFKKSSSEHTLFTKRNDIGYMLIVNVYVDDLIYTGDNEAMLQEFKESMKREFQMSDLGRMRFFLGIEVVQVASGVHISQQKYAEEILKRFEMEGCNSVVNPIVPGNKLGAGDDDPTDTTRFKKLVGSLMYITITRPDIQFVVNLISRFSAAPTEAHFAAAKRVLRYLQGTLDFGIWYKKGGTGLLKIYTDSDFAGDVDSRKSTSRYVFLWDDGAVAWSSKKQDIFALSSTEAEYVAAAACACQAVWVKEVLEELGINVIECMKISCDNTSTIKLSKNPVFHGRCNCVSTLG